MRRDPRSVTSRRRFHPGEAGYALVALLAVMTLMALFALAAAPSIRQQTQRDLERETIFRGEQVADAIRIYYLNRQQTLGTRGDQALPTSIEQLLEGIPVAGGSKKRQILRVSASRDPLSSSHEWGFVRPRSQKLINFQRNVMLYAGNAQPATNSQLTEMLQFSVPALRPVLGLESTTSEGEGEDLLDESGGPFVGVASRSRRDSVLYYYGIKQHDDWVFTPLFKP